MLKPRIIPCLDIKAGRTVKGVNFENLVDLGDPVELAKRYEEESADELVFLDITASLERRKTMFTWVERVAAELSIPFTVGGGINQLETVEELLKLGADKVAVNTAGIENPKLLQQIAERFGNQCLVVAIDYKFIGDEAFVFTYGGKKVTSIKLISWIKEVQERGAGEILLTAMDKDGTKSGFDLATFKSLEKVLKVPLIASGGAGEMTDFKALFQQGIAQAGLAAGTFHRKEISIPMLKEFLIEENIPCRQN